MAAQPWDDDHLALIREAAGRIKGHVRRTPLLGTDMSPGLMIKPESLQVTGSFKARGAVNAVLSLLDLRHQNRYPPRRRRQIRRECRTRHAKFACNASYRRARMNLINNTFNHSRYHRLFR